MKTITLMGLVMGLLVACAAPDANSRDRYNRYDRPEQRWHQQDRCNNCGRVDRITYAGGRNDSHGGAVAGAVIGGVIGNQVGHGDDRRAATVAGAVIGGIIGNKSDKNSRRRYDRGYDILVRFDNGRAEWFRQRELRGVREGARVQVRRGLVRLR